MMRNDSPVARYNKARYSCPLCPDRFDTVGDKRRHMKAEHAEEKKP